MTDPDVPKSCATCPSFLLPHQTVSKFRKSIGAPMCGRYGYVLGKPGAKVEQNKRIQEQFAKDCDSHGKELPPIPTHYKLNVLMPDLDAREETPAGPAKDACRTCAMCTKFVREDVVLDELGFTAGVCSAKGKLILTTRQTQEAKDCEYREVGPNRGTTGGMGWLPEYELSFGTGIVDPVKAYFNSKASGFVEPHEYPSDKEVTDHDREIGIRAWIAVPDPDGSGMIAYLPSYEPSFFSETEREKIPRTGDEEHPELYVDHFGGTYAVAVAWTELDETPALWGQAGIGKTELFRYLAWRMCLPFERISITASTEIDEIAGKMEFSPEKGTFFRYGRLPKAWIKPCVLVIDEPNLGPVEVWHHIRPLTDNSKQMVLDMNEAEHLDRHLDCYFGMAMNPAWDIKNVGALQVADADTNRLYHLFVDLPPEPLEREIIANRVALDGWELESEQLDMVMEIAKELRTLIEQEGTLPITWALRPQIKVARALRWFSPVTAYRRAAADYLDPESQQILLDVVRAHVKED